MDVSSSLTGTEVVVLGGTSGVGLATAQLAAGAGAQVTVVSSRRTSVDKALAGLPGSARGVAADLTDPTAVRAVFDELGAIDHLVFTAGEPLSLMPIGELDTTRAHTFFELRYFGALTAVHAGLPHLRDGGSITLTTGSAGARPSPGWSVAASIVGAVDALTRALAVELAPRIRVNAVSPGVLRSPMWDALPAADRDAFYAGTAASVPLGRIGEVDDPALAYLYVMSQPFATGTVTAVDGGALLA
ncbi:SDR family oxidoreductase [Pseudonocardia sp. N23]|uniref:SDR family oxidoreductase n=1 Tax=Pseudonocardia sp. N23 TaxID=1987376 RepID=UPI000BFB2D91|nr:SDR family oxidoreductase [Pseudonocardia sp. N23]GAY08491.1 short-chain dehydrogenase [Pseudonocardia sp. N23]